MCLTPEVLEIRVLLLYSLNEDAEPVECGIPAFSFRGDVFVVPVKSIKETIFT